MNTSLKSRVMSVIKSRLASLQEQHDDEIAALEDKHEQDKRAVTDRYVESILSKVI